MVLFTEFAFKSIQNFSSRVCNLKLIFANLHKIKYLFLQNNEKS